MHYHPFEFGIVGHSGAGKTTLATRLIERMRDRYRIGFYKSDAHRFAMDKPGKDTHRAWEAGAERVYINDREHAALIHLGATPETLLREMFSDLDLLLVEGRKRSAMPKLLLLDPRDEARELLEGSEPPENIHAVVGSGTRPDYVPEAYPYIDRDDIASIEHLLASELARRAAAVPLKALVLTGGYSKRMGVEKAFIAYHGEPEIHRMVRLTDEVADETYVSCRPEQTEDPRLADFTLLPDRFVDIGPMGGILTAMHRDPEAAWLVLSCDLPYMDGAALGELLRKRNPFRAATAYLDSQAGLPEPLAAVWEPKARRYLHRHLAEGHKCPRGVLRAAPISGVVPADPCVVENVNHPAERDRAMRELGGACAPDAGGPAATRAGHGTAGPHGADSGVPIGLSDAVDWGRP
jgi:molybdopterin-guanine dinucleotide biosynthesis protein MobB